MHIEKGRLGQFFFLMGLLGLVIFFTTDQSQNPQYLFFCGGALLILLGTFLFLRAFIPPAESSRFRGVRKWRQQQAERKKARQEKKQQKKK
jgi:hypothetical protein